jgi:hypothetical protein
VDFIRSILPVILSFVPSVTSIVPVTVVVAVTIFFTKELLEFFRRRFADQRKLAAIKTMFARELELNNWTLKTLRRTLDAIDEGLKESSPRIFSIREERGGRTIIRVGEHGSSKFSEWQIPNVHTDIMPKHMLDTATLDKDLFQALQLAYDATADLQHVRDSLIRTVANEQQQIDMAFVEPFIDYAKRELDDIAPDLSQLYKLCTGKALEDHRLR